MTINNKQWLTPTELQDEFGFSKSTQAKYRMDRKIPYHKVSRYIRYSRDEINKWLQEHKVEVV